MAQPSAQGTAAPPSPAAAHIASAKQAQQKRDLAGAVAEYRLAVEADPDNADAHSGFISATQSFEYDKAGLGKAETTAERRTALYGGRTAAAKTLADFYAALDARHPTSAAVKWAMGRVDSDAPDKAEAYYRKAIALDPHFARAYLDIGRLALEADDRGKAAEFLGKASECEPANDYYAYLAATARKTIDRSQYLRAIDTLIQRFAKSAWAARGLADSAVGSAPADAVQRLERMRREFPDTFKEGYAPRLFDAYLSAGAAVRASEFASAQLASAPAGRQQDQWKARVAYGDAIVEARRLMEAGKSAEVRAFVDKTIAAQSQSGTDRKRLDIIWASAASAAGDHAAALDRLIDMVAAAPTAEGRAELEKCRIAAKRTPDDVERAVWERRTKTAQAMADFTLGRLDTGAKVHLGDLRGKVVLVNFWFPG